MKLRIIAFAIILIFGDYISAAKKIYDFEIDGIRYTIIGENIVEINGISDDINPERQIPEFEELDEAFCLGGEIIVVDNYFSEHPITPTFLTVPGSVSWEGVSYDVVRIGDGAMCHVNFTHVQFPSTVKEIGAYAFWYSGIFHIEGLENISKIEKEAFSECIMDSVIISENVESIPKHCLYRSWIKTLVIKGNPKFEDRACANCELGTIICMGLSPLPINCSNAFSFMSGYWDIFYGVGPCSYTRLKIPAKSYDKYMAAGWDKFANKNVVSMPEPCIHVDISTPESKYTLCALNMDNDPNALKIVGVYAAENANIKIPATVEVDGVERPITEIGRTAFYEYKLGNISVPYSVESVGAYAFSNSTIAKIEGLENIRHLGDGAFQTSRIDYLTYPRTENYVGSNMFANSHYRKLILTENTKQIYVTALYEHYIDTLICLASTPPSIYLDFDDVYISYEHDSNLHYLYVPAASIEQYKNAEYFKYYHNILPIENSTGIAFNEAVSAAGISIKGNQLMINVDADIYRVSGQLIGHLRSGESLTLPAGIYFARCGNFVRKIAIP